jgi:predicted phosphate transport protein (TIGR00153 family)
MRFLPKDEHYFNLFDALGDEIAKAATLLRELFHAPGRRDELVAAIGEVEHRADAVAHQTIIRLDRTFVVPWDREDIHLCATRLDTVVDMIDDTAQRAQMYRLDAMRPAAQTLSQIVERAAGHLCEAVHLLRHTSEVVPHVQAVKALEEEADGVYQRAVAELFTVVPPGNAGALEVLKWKDVYDALEDVTDGCNHAAQALESLAVKHG